MATYNKNDYQSSDGMVTAIWGPGLWHFLHTMSFNYPINPTKEDKKNYKAFITSLQFVLPCRYCRENLIKNFNILPLTIEVMKNRNSFSRYIYKLHELVNKMLNKKSGLTYCQVRERYEHFRSRCTVNDPPKIEPKKEKGCTEPLYGKKAKCIIKIVPQEEQCPTLEIDQSCIKRKLKH